jgi:hypothetical protein
MLGPYLRKFIEQMQALRHHPDWSEYDEDYLSRCEREFPAEIVLEDLSPAQLKWLLDLFDRRSRKIKDTKDDYTFGVTVFHEPWIELSKHLVMAARKTIYIQILLPGVKNLIDPNDYAKYQDTDSIDHFFIGEDQTTLYSLSGLMVLQSRRAAQVKKSGYLPLVTYKPPTAYEKKARHEPRALSPTEFFRLQSKQGDYRFDMVSKANRYAVTHYTSVWTYFKDELLPEWHKGGKVPRYLAALLWELVGLYFADDAAESVDFRRHLFSLSSAVLDYNARDVNCLYGQTIALDTGSCFLLEILLDCFRMGRPIDPLRMIGLARWVSLYDPSFTVKHRLLTKTYLELKIGPSYPFEHLQTNLTQLCLQLPKPIIPEVKPLLDIVLRESKFTRVALQAVVDIFTLRWTHILKAQPDMLYTCRLSGENAKWRHQAALLAGAGYFTKNYYRVLMPTLKHEVDAVQQVSITFYGLDYYILSDDGSYLILLLNSEKYLLSHTEEILYNCSTVPVSFFTEKEIRYLHDANPRYRRYIKYTQATIPDFALAKSTILEIQKLVNESFFSIGLDPSPDAVYDPRQQARAEMAYQNFQFFLSELPQQELKNLLMQRIISEGKIHNVKSILHAIQNYQCIAPQGILWAQLVLAYAPWLTFKASVERLEAVRSVRASASFQGKVFYDYRSIDGNEARRRLHVLATSILSHSFQSWFRAATCSLWDCKNNVVGVVNDIYTALLPFLTARQYQRVRFLYVLILESIVIPALSNQSFSGFGYWKMTPTTIEWLESITSGSLFTTPGSWYEPPFLFKRLNSLKNGLKGKIAKEVFLFLDQLVWTYRQDETAATKAVRVNVKFKALLRKFDERDRQLFLRDLQPLEYVPESYLNSFLDRRKSTEPSVSESTLKF